MTEYVRSEEERLDDIRMGRDARERKENQADTAKGIAPGGCDQTKAHETKIPDRIKLEVALTSLTEEKSRANKLQAEVNLLKADVAGLQARIADEKEMVKKLSFVTANTPVDKKVEQLVRELEKFRGLYMVYESFIVGDKGFQTVICDPITRRCWLDEGLYPQEEQDKKLVKAYRDMQARNEIDTKIVAEQEPEALHIE